MELNENERERWRGVIDADIRSIKDDIKTILEQNVACATDRRTLDVAVGSIATKAAVGAFAGGAIMQIAIRFISHP